MAKMNLPARLENLDSMLSFIGNSAEKQGFGSKEIDQIQIACEEPLVNIISYAYPDKDGAIKIVCNTGEGIGLVVEITDCGTPFDPLSVSEPDTGASAEERGVGGLGIYMMRNIMDEVSYKREGNRNVLTLTKY